MLIPAAQVQIIDKEVERLVETIRPVPVDKRVERTVERIQVGPRLQQHAPDDDFATFS